MRVFRVLALLAVTAGFTGVTGLTHAGDVYTVSGIEVDATAENAADAREVAHDQARRRAFERIVARLVRADDAALVPTPPASALVDMAASISIAEERNSSNRYLARVSVRMRPDSVRGVLRRNNIAFSETQARSAVVVPIYEGGGGPELWKQTNPWLAAWSVRSLANELTPVEAPLGDLTDISMLGIDQALNGDWYDLTSFAERYDAQDILIAYAEQVVPDDDGTVFAGGSGLAGSTTRLNVTLYRVSKTGRDTLTLTVDGPAPAGLAPPAGGPDAIPDPALTQPLGPDGLPVAAPVAPNRAGADETPVADTVFTRAVAASVQAMAADWKNRTLVDYGRKYRMDVTVRLASLQDWTDIRRKLEEIPTVTQWRTIAVSATGAEVILVFAGTVEQLALNLDQRGLMLSGENGFWEIQRRGIVPAALENPAGQRPAVYSVGQEGVEFSSNGNQWPGVNNGANNGANSGSSAPGAGQPVPVVDSLGQPIAPPPASVMPPASGAPASTPPVYGARGYQEAPAYQAPVPQVPLPQVPAGPITPGYQTPSDFQSPDAQTPVTQTPGSQAPVVQAPSMRGAYVGPIPTDTASYGVPQVETYGAAAQPWVGPAEEVGPDGVLPSLDNTIATRPSAQERFEALGQEGGEDGTE